MVQQTGAADSGDGQWRSRDLASAGGGAAVGVTAGAASVLVPSSYLGIQKFGGERA